MPISRVPTASTSSASATHPVDNISLLLLLMDAMRGDVQAKLPDSCSFMHIKALNFIALQKDPSMKDLADFLKITSPGATLVIDKLVENKDLDRISDNEDRRIVRLAITAKGKIALSAGMKIIKERIESRITTLSKDEQKQLAIILQKLINYNQ